jgi:hypothetical protein
VDGALLVHHLDGRQAVREVGEGIDDGPAAVAGDADGVRNVLPYEVVGQHLAAGESHVASLASAAAETTLRRDRSTQ